MRSQAARKTDWLEKISVLPLTTFQTWFFRQRRDAILQVNVAPLQCKDFTQAHRGGQRETNDG